MTASERSSPAGAGRPEFAGQPADPAAADPLAPGRGPAPAGPSPLAPEGFGDRLRDGHGASALFAPSGAPPPPASIPPRAAGPGPERSDPTPPPDSSGAAPPGPSEADPVPALWGQDRLPLSRAQVLEFRRLYGTHTDAELCQRFGLPAEQIQALARRFALAKDKAFNRRLPGAEPTAMPRWTRAELELLVQLYPGTANLEIARRLQRTIKSVVSKAHHLGLKKTQSRLAEMGRENVALRYGEFAPGRSGELLPQPSRRTRNRPSPRVRARRGGG